MDIMGKIVQMNDKLFKILKVKILKFVPPFRTTVVRWIESYKLDGRTSYNKIIVTK